MVIWFRYRSALQIVNKDHLFHVIEQKRNTYLEDEELQERGYKKSMWNSFKHNEIKETLKEGGNLRYLASTENHRIRERQPTPRYDT